LNSEKRVVDRLLRGDCLKAFGAKHKASGRVSCFLESLAQSSPIHFEEICSIDAVVSKDILGFWRQMLR
jgi:hypothetical protein